MPGRRPPVRPNRAAASGRERSPTTVLSVFGTRPEVIKLAPVLRELERRPERFRTVNVVTSQHTDLLRPFVRFFDVRADHDLAIMRPGQALNPMFSRIIAALDPILCREAPDLVLVQGDTTSAVAGALAARHRRIPVGHVEAGLRSGNPDSPFPEEINRQLISRLATCHFAATPHNVETLLGEGIPADSIVLTGNPVVDALKSVLGSAPPSDGVRALLAELRGRRLVVLTSHRRESFGEVMQGNLRVLRRFVERHQDIALLFPVHPNPAVREAAYGILSGAPRIKLVDPLDYADFLHVLAEAWLIVSDSGGLQEEAPSLGKPLLILRENTERPEAVACGVARLVGGAPERLAAMLEEIAEDDAWVRWTRRVENPFGRGDSAARIVAAIDALFAPADADAASALPEGVR